MQSDASRSLHPARQELILCFHFVSVVYHPFCPISIGWLRFQPSSSRLMGILMSLGADTLCCHHCRGLSDRSLYDSPCASFGVSFLRLLARCASRHSASLGSIPRVSQSRCNRLQCHKTKKKKIYWKSDPWRWRQERGVGWNLRSAFTAGFQGVIVAGEWRWVSSYKPVLRINYLIRRSQQVV